MCTVLPCLSSLSLHTRKFCFWFRSVQPRFLDLRFVFFLGVAFSPSGCISFNPKRWNSSFFYFISAFNVKTKRSRDASITIVPQRGRLEKTRRELEEGRDGWRRRRRDCTKQGRKADQSVWTGRICLRGAVLNIWSCRLAGPSLSEVFSSAPFHEVVLPFLFTVCAAFARISLFRRFSLDGPRARWFALPCT